MGEHLQHIPAVLTILHQHWLVIKCSKCVFGVTSIAYLGHVIFVAVVAMDPNKV
jgi:hypothetical protein